MVVQVANRRLTRVDISGVTVADHTSGGSISGSLLSWEIREDFGNPIYTANIKFTKNLTDTVTLATGQSVDIFTGFINSSDVREFRGELQSYEPEAGKITVKAVNKLYRAVRETINAKVYDKEVVGNEINPDGKISDAFLDIVTSFAKLNADSTTIQDSGTGTTITKFVMDHTDPKERMDRLAEALGWYYYYDSIDDKVHFRPKQTTENTNILEVGRNVTGVPKWKYNRDDMINDLRLDGLFQNRELRELFSGDGSATAFTLDFVPVSETAVYTSGAVNYANIAPRQRNLQVLGVLSGSVTTFDYTVDRTARKINFESGSIPVTGTNNILADYVGAVSVPVHLVEDVSVETFGRHARTMQLTDVITVDDAEARVALVLDKFSQEFQSTELKVRQVSGVSFAVGDSIQVIDTQNNPSVSGSFTIFGLVKQYPSAVDVVKIGDREFEAPEFWINQSERIHRLERELLSEETVLTELRRTTMSMTAVPHSLVIQEQYINDTFMAGHVINGFTYDATETSTVDDFESAGDWTDQGTPTLTISNNTEANTHWVGTQGVKVAWADTTGTGVIRNTQSQGNLTNVTGVSTGTPTRGTGGVWVHGTSGSIITSLNLRIGSSASDYVDVSGAVFADRVAHVESGFFLTSGARSLVLFDLNDPATTAGTADWSAIDFTELRWGIVSGGSLTFDYLTVSRNDTISQTGLGARFTEKVSGTTVY